MCVCVCVENIIQNVDSSEVGLSLSWPEHIA